MPSLYIVGTPIGNLEDLTFRAKNILSEVGYIFSEDTRVTKKLLYRYYIKSKFISIYQSNKNVLPLKKIHNLRYGENPHQKAAIFSLGNSSIKKIAEVI